MFNANGLRRGRSGLLLFWAGPSWSNNPGRAVLDSACRSTRPCCARALQRECCLGRARPSRCDCDNVTVDHSCAKNCPPAKARSRDFFFSTVGPPHGGCVTILLNRNFVLIRGSERLESASPMIPHDPHILSCLVGRGTSGCLSSSPPPLLLFGLDSTLNQSRCLSPPSSPP